MQIRIALLLTLVITLSGCHIPNLIRESTEAIEANREAVIASTEAIKRNHEEVEKSNAAIEENRRKLEEINNYIDKLSQRFLSLNE